MTRLEQYLNSPNWVSLGSWADASRVSNKGFGHHENELSIHEIDLSWTTKIQRLEQGHRLKVWRTANIARFLRRSASQHVSMRRVHPIWVHLPVRHRLVRWQDAMLWCMQNNPKRALGLLLVTMKGRAFRPPRHMVQGCLKFLSRKFLSNISEPEPEALKAIWHLTFKFVGGASPEELRSYAVSQEVIHLLLRHCDGTKAILLYQTLASNRADLKPNTLLHFLEKFADMGKLHLSMALLKEITRRCRVTFLGEPQLQSACVKLLRTRWSTAEPYLIQSQILSQMLELGIRPNTQMYNVILLNMIEGHDFDTAWKTFDIARQSFHFKTDTITYCILAKGAKLSGDFNILELVIRETNENPELQDTRLTSNILNAIGELNPGNEFPTMLDFYKEKFDLRPLQELRLCRFDVKAPENGNAEGKWPDKYVLGQMILAYNKFHGSPEGLIERYNLYHRFVRHEHPLFAPFAYDDYVANSFLMAFGQNFETLQYCTVVLKNMLTPPWSPNSAPHAAPTVQTWSILLAAYMLHKQKVAAEKVLTMMRERGLQPDVVTWNMLVGGYAAMQDAEGAMGALRRMEEVGFQANSRTLKALGRLYDKRNMLEMLRASMEETQEQKGLPYEELKEMVDADEVEEMFERDESDDLDERQEEVRKYLEGSRQRYE